MSNHAPLPLCEPAEVGFIPSRLAQLGPAMQKHIDSGRIPNAVTLVARHGRIVHFEARGLLTVDEPTPVDHNSLFRLYSNSKPLCGLATMILFEEGRLSPDDPISKYIPAFRNLKVRGSRVGLPMEPARREITIRDCLRHTTGLARLHSFTLDWKALYQSELDKLGWEQHDGVPAPPASLVPAKTAREYVDVLARLPLTFQPGSDFDYHSGYVVAGAVLEEVAGQSLDEFYRERIFKPLGMEDSSFNVDASKVVRFTSNHRLDNSNGTWKLSVIDRAAESEKVRGDVTFFEAGGGIGGGVVSTAGDYSRFGQMLLNGGELEGVRLLGRKTVEYMTADHSEGMSITLPGPGYGWGMGVAVRHGRDGVPALPSTGSYTWNGYAGTHWLADPVEDLQIICFTQVTTTSQDRPYWADCERIVYQSLA